MPIHQSPIKLLIYQAKKIQYIVNIYSSHNFLLIIDSYLISVISGKDDYLFYKSVFSTELSCLIYQLFSEKENVGK